MKQAFLLSAFIALIALGAGCANQQQTSPDGLFIGTNQNQEILSNSGKPLPSSTPTPSGMGPQ